MADWQQNRQEALVANQPFFDLVYRDLRGMVAIITRDEEGKLNSERWFPCDEIESVRQYAAARHDEDVYFSTASFPPNPNNKKVSSRESTPESLTNVVYADADTCDPSLFRLMPSIIVTTSPGRWHCLWVMDTVMAGQLVAELSAKVSTAHAAQGCDKHAKDTKILRVPGTTNTKYGLPHTVTAEYTGKVYTYAEFSAAYEDITLSKVPIGSTLGRLDMSVYMPEQVTQLETYAKTCWDNAVAELGAEAAKGWVEDRDGWDNVSYKISCKLARIAAAPWTTYTIDDVVEAMDSSPLNDGSFLASAKLERVIHDIRDEYLALPEWALSYQKLNLPDVLDYASSDLEERVERAGLYQWYVSVPQDGEANTVTLDFIARCRENGFSSEEIFAIVVNSSVFRVSTYTREHIWIHLMGNLDIEVEIPDNIRAKRGWHEIPPFLSEQEREWCASNPTYPDEHVKWVQGTGTDAATVYQRTMAFVILSSVYGDLAFLREGYADPRLNFYAQCLGDSTLTRKTTALNRALTVIREFEARTGKAVELTSNATSEALNKALSEDDGKVKLMWTDEIQGYLDEMNNKRYLAGFLSTLAKLYDGKVEASLRIGKESGNGRAEVTFNFVGVGIRKHVATVLTTKNYESGLMPRFVWAVADPPPFTENAMDVDLDPAKRDDEYGKYATLTPIINQMVRSRRKLGEDLFQPVFISREANELFNRMGREVSKYLLASDQVEYLSAAQQRFGTNVRKAAALLALHEGTRDVSVGHMLHAIRQAEYWFRDMVRMANEVAATDFERQVDEMEKYIIDASKNRRPYSDVRNKFRGMKTQDFQECLGNLVARGRAKHDVKAGVITAFVI